MRELEMTKFKVTRCNWQRQCFTYNPLIGWSFIPGLTARIPHDGNFYLMRTNSAGMRSDREYPLRRPENRKRIVLLGDSYTAGEGVSNGERFSDLLERLYPHLDVMNFGLSNTGTDQQCLVYETVAKKYEADAYIFAILVENIVRNGQTCRPSWDHREQTVVYRPKPYFTLEGEQLLLHNQPVPLEKRLASDLREWKCDWPLIAEYPAEPYAVYRLEDGLLWRLQKRIIERFLKQVEGKPVFIMPLPMCEHYLEKNPPIYLERFKELEDVSRKRHLLNVLPNFLVLPMKERLKCHSANDPHYTVLAHRIVADAISREISGLCPELLTTANKEVS